MKKSRSTAAAADDTADEKRRKSLLPWHRSKFYLLDFTVQFVKNILKISNPLIVLLDTDIGDLKKQCLHICVQ